jgi:hypothetical protein
VLLFVLLLVLLVFRKRHTCVIVRERVLRQGASANQGQLQGELRAGRRRPGGLLHPLVHFKRRAPTVLTITSSDCSNVELTQQALLNLRAE